MSTRNTVSCMAQGQAAGTAAALAVKEGKLPRDVDVHALQQLLLRQDCFIPGFNSLSQAGGIYL